MVPPEQPVAVSVAFSVPQTDALLEAIVGAVAVRPTVIVTEAEFPDVPQLVVQVAVYVPALTSFEVPTPKPPDHVMVPPSQPEAVRVAFSVPQIDVLLATTVGALGACPEVTVTVFEFPETPQLVVQVAV
jgi:hypothetical protein